MPLKIVDHGTDNSVELAPGVELAGRITFNGSGNRIAIGQIGKCGRLDVTVGSGCTIAIGTSVSWKRATIQCKSDARLSIGPRSAFNGGVTISMGEPSSITIGEACLFADDASMATSDHHAIYDLDTGRRVNEARPIAIGDRVWAGAGVRILKGARIGDGAILGARAVVGGRVPPCSIAAGNPARIVRRRVGWDSRISDQMPKRRLADFRAYAAVPDEAVANEGWGARLKRLFAPILASMPTRPRS